ncbi:MAG: hypothetical protein QMD05_06625 [Candidatus Brocadiaceae bacterium]|nr:hypothetical protein [Candidatus Brocadiaceae bacterium]
MERTAAQAGMPGIRTSCVAGENDNEVVSDGDVNKGFGLAMIIQLEGAHFMNMFEKVVHQSTPFLLAHFDEPPASWPQIVYFLKNQLGGEANLKEFVEKVFKQREVGKNAEAIAMFDKYFPDWSIKETFQFFLLGLPVIVLANTVGEKYSENPKELLLTGFMIVLYVFLHKRQMESPKKDRGCYGHHQKLADCN